MITNIKFDRWKLVTLETDDWCINRYPLTKEIQVSEYKYNFKLRRTERVNKNCSLNYFEGRTCSGLIFKYTQFPILLNYYAKLGILDKSVYEIGMDEFNVSEINPNKLPKSICNITLRDDQLEILRDVMTKRFGLIQIYTGYGKTELIAYMTAYYTKVLNWRVLITGPNAKVLDEINKRIVDRVGISPGINYPNDSNIILINGGSVSHQSWSHHDYKDYLSEVDAVLSDEVGSCLSNTHMQVYNYCRNRKCMYGFSATPDRACESLSIYGGIDDIYFRNKKLLDVFGGSLITLKPDGFDINIIKVIVDNWELHDKNLIDVINKFYESNDVSVLPVNFRNLVDNDLFMQPILPKVLSKLSKRYPNLMVTINRTQIIDYWISNLPDFKVLEISGRGYRFHFNGSYKSFKLDQIKDIYLEADLIFGSKSLIMGVDLPKLTNSVQLSGRKSDVTIQSIGRTARSRLMNIILLSPSKFVLGYSNQNKERVNLIKYQYNPEINNITESTINFN